MPKEIQDGHYRAGCGSCCSFSYRFFMLLSASIWDSFKLEPCYRVHGELKTEQSWWCDTFLFHLSTAFFTFSPMATKLLYSTSPTNRRAGVISREPSSPHYHRFRPEPVSPCWTVALCSLLSGVSTAAPISTRRSYSLPIILYAPVSLKRLFAHLESFACFF
jgi:hypothetical protein